MNNPNEFPLNLHRLTRYAARWAAELPGITSVKLYPYRSFLAKENDKHKSSAKYAVVFQGGNPGELWGIITDDSGKYSNLIDDGFADVYNKEPGTNFRNDWVFTISDFADGNEFSSIMTTEPHWVLYPAAQEGQDQAPAAKSFQDFINEAKKNKMPDALIAVELKEKYSLTYLQIARELNLDHDLQPEQIDAAKQRAKRLIDKGRSKKCHTLTLP